MKDDADFLPTVREKFKRAHEASDDNRRDAVEDIEFARLGKQWPAEIQKIRDDDHRPCLTINRLATMVRLVVNEARQNRPAISVIPADSGADVETAEIMSGLIRNIEVTSDADVAYDSAVESAVSGGFGYFRINTAYTDDDSFDQDIVIERIADAMTVYEDPDSSSADGSDWNCCFVVTTLTCDEFAEKYKGAEPVDWEAEGYNDLGAPWRDGENVMVAEYWHREEVSGQIIALSDGSVVDLDAYRSRADEYQAFGIAPVGQPRTVKRKKVTQYILSGAEVLETVEWPGKYIPIVPVYGDEVVLDGKRHYRSLIRDAKDAQREHNYWRTAAAELVALAPKTPFIGPKGAFRSDVGKWSTANTASHAFIEYDGPTPPQRQPFNGGPAAELQQAAAAVDDIKAIVGLYDASLGLAGNETSGVAIRQRQRQGNIATFHFIDNLSRSIRQAGRILLDLIPKVYSTQRMVRVLGEDMEPQNVQIGQQDEGNDAAEMMRVYDLTAGKYDLIVKTGPSYSTQREEARAEIVEVIRSYPDSATILGPMYLRNSDWPGADEAAELLEASRGGGEGGNPQQMQAQMGQMQQVIQQGSQKLAELEAENRELKQQFQLKAMELQIKNKEADIKAQEVAVKQQAAQAQALGNVARANAQQMPGNQFAVNGSG